MHKPYSERGHLNDILRGVNRPALMQAFADLLTRYGVDTSILRNIPTSWRLDDSIRYGSDGHLVLASAEQQMPRFYVPCVFNIASSAMLEMVAVSTYCHELIHYLGTRKLSSTILRGDDDTRETRYREVTGFMVSIVTSTTEFGIRRESVETYFHLFNEGVVESFARELYLDYLQIVQPLHRPAAHLFYENRGNYPVELRFVNDLMFKLARTSGQHVKKVRCWVLDALCRGTVLTEDPTWLTYIDKASLPGLTTMLLAPESKDLEMMRVKHLVQKVSLNRELEKLVPELEHLVRSAASK